MIPLEMSSILQALVAFWVCAAASTLHLVRDPRETWVKTIPWFEIQRDRRWGAG